MPDPYQKTPPGVIVSQSPDTSRVYVGSPSIAVLPDGSYVASHDFFGPGTSKDTTVVFRSTDRGLHWEKLCELRGQWWSSLFVHDGLLYTMGTSGPGGGVAIRRSDDGGRNWTTPADETTGLLRTGGRHHCAPVPVIEWRGRLWRAYEWKLPGEGLAGNRVFLISAPVGADLLRADSWRASECLQWPSGTHYRGWREGNVVVGPDDNLAVVIRVDELRRGGMAGMLHLMSDGQTLAFDPARDFIRFPGGCKKFTVRHDPVSNRYWSLTNWAQEKDMPPKALNVERMRNTLALISSADLRNWTVEAVVLYHPDVRNVGFQYADWQFEGEDIVAAVRTAFGGATNCHNANYMTFHRIPNFRRVTATRSTSGHTPAACKRPEAQDPSTCVHPADVDLQAPVTWNKPDAFDPQSDLCPEYYQTIYGPAAKEMMALVGHYALHAYEMNGIHSAPIIKQALHLCDQAAGKVAQDSLLGRDIAMFAKGLEVQRQWYLQIKDGRVAPLRYRTVQAPGNIKVDGMLDEDFWRDLPGSLKDVKHGGEVQYPTTFKIGVRDNNVYIGVKCQDAVGEPLNAVQQPCANMNLWNGDLVEILLETPVHSYYQIAVNPMGSIFNSNRNADPAEQPRRWNSQSEVAVYVDQAAGFWSLEFRIPLAVNSDDPWRGVIGSPPSTENPWFFNICRQRIRKSKAATEFSAFSPTGSGFHNILKFAKLV